MAANKGALTTYVPNVVERVSYESAMVEHKPLAGPAGHTGDPVQDLEAKLKYINDVVPTRIQNVSGSTAGAGSGDFHQFRMSRRREQMRLERMDKEAAEAEAQRTFEERQRQHAQAAEERTAKNRLKRAKKKEKRNAKKPRVEGAQPGGAPGDHDRGSSSSEDEDGAAAAADLD